MLKKLTVLLIFALILSVFASCGESDGKETTAEAVISDTAAEVDTEPQQTEPETEAAVLRPAGKKITEDAKGVWEIPEFKVSGVFGSDMVVQRNEYINVWGFSTHEGATVTASFDGETVTSTVEGGEWAVTFSPRKESAEPKNMTFDDGNGNTEVLERVLIGDVWIVAGQSNAELTLMNCSAYNPDTLPDANDNIRLFMQSRETIMTKPASWAYPQPDTVSAAFAWHTCESNYPYTFSALGFYFAKNIYSKLNIPIGVISMSAGGACLRELMSEKLAAKLKYTERGTVTPGGYYNTMIYPFTGMSFKGMIFFQGESEGQNKNQADKYDRDLTEFVAELREDFGFEFPFYNVQLSDYREEGLVNFPLLHVVRIRQFSALSSIPNSYLITSHDLGSPEGYKDFAHSPRKKELADRISSLALAKEYGIGDAAECSSPSPVSATVSEDKKHILIKFENVGQGLTSLTGTDELAGFSFGKFTNMTNAETAKIIAPDTVSVEIPDGMKVSSLTYINYALENHLTNENAPLYGNDGLPVPAFSLAIKK